MRFASATAALLALGVLGGQARAANIIVNGSFENLTDGPGQLAYNTYAVGWTNSGYYFAFGPGTADTTGVPSAFGPVTLWGPNNGSANGLPATSPDGGNFIAASSDFGAPPMQQYLGGLTPGGKYDVTFWYGFGQEYDADGDSIQHLTVSLGAESHDTPDYDVPSHGFTGWIKTTMTFTASSASEVLSFLAYGNVPVPPFALIDGVRMEPSSVPEPASLALLLVGAGGIAAAARRRRNRPA